MAELIIAMILWGTLGAFVLWSGLPVIDITFYRCLIGAFFIGCWLIRAKESIKLDKMTAITTIAGVFLILNWVFLFKSFQVSSITIGNVSYYLQPIILLILGIFIYNEKINFQKWLLISLALLGVMFTIDFRNFNSPHILMGAFLALLAALFYSFVTLLMKSVNLNYFKVILIQLLIGVVILLPFVHFQSVSLIALICLIIVATVHTLCAYFLYYKAIKKINFTQIAVISYLDPIVAIATDVLFFNRKLNVYQFLGVGLTFFALYLLVTKSDQPVPAVEAKAL